MGLENLKSAFSNIRPFDKTPQHGAPGEQHIATHSNLDKISVTDFIDSPILGLTLKFNEIYQSQLVPGGGQNMIEPTISPINSWNIDSVYRGPVNFFKDHPSDLIDGFTKNFNTIDQTKLAPNNTFINPPIMTDLLGQIGSTVDYQNLQFYMKLICLDFDILTNVIQNANSYL